MNSFGLQAPVFYEEVPPAPPGILWWHYKASMFALCCADALLQELASETQLTRIAVSCQMA